MQGGPIIKQKKKTRSCHDRVLPVDVSISRLFVSPRHHHTGDDDDKRIGGHDAEQGGEDHLQKPIAVGREWPDTPLGLCGRVDGRAGIVGDEVRTGGVVVAAALESRLEQPLRLDRLSFPDFGEHLSGAEGGHPDDEAEREREDGAHDDHPGVYSQQFCV